MFDRKQQNSIKQLSFNEKINKFFKSCIFRDFPGGPVAETVLPMWGEGGGGAWI